MVEEKDVRGGRMSMSTMQEGKWSANCRTNYNNCNNKPMLNENNMKCVNEMEQKWIDGDKARQNTATNNREHQWECKVFHLVLVFKQDESDIFQ